MPCPLGSGSTATLLSVHQGVVIGFLSIRRSKSALTSCLSVVGHCTRSPPGSELFLRSGPYPGKLNLSATQPQISSDRPAWYGPDVPRALVATQCCPPIHCVRACPVSVWRLILTTRLTEGAVFVRCCEVVSRDTQQLLCWWTGAGRPSRIARSLFARTLCPSVLGG